MLLGLTEPEIKALGSWRAKQRELPKRYRLHVLLSRMAFKGTRTQSARVRFAKVLAAYAREGEREAIHVAVKTCLGEQKAEVVNG